MQINIKNAAKVRKADLMLDGLTVIAGYNNMGKSTILKAAYLTFRTFRNPIYKAGEVRVRSLSDYFQNLRYDLGQHGYDYLPREFFSEIILKMKEYLIGFMNVRQDDFGLIKNIFKETWNEYQDFVTGTKGRNEFFSDDILKPVYEKIQKIAVRDVEEDLIYIAEMYLRNLWKGQINSLHNNSFMSIEIVSGMENYFMDIRENKVAKIRYSVNQEPEVFYLPAYHLLDLVNKPAFASVTHSTESDLQSALMSQKTEPSLEEHREMEKNTAFVKEILEEVLHGKLEKLPSGKIFFQDEVLHQSVDLGNVASGMKNFLVIQSLIEKGKLKRNSILMIDEPETNLHPQWHLEFAEILVLLYKHMGIRSIVNSHSPYFIRALEVKMADERLKENGHYYLMEEAGKNLFQTRDVTEHTDQIYERLYRPLEYL